MFRISMMAMSAAVLLTMAFLTAYSAWRGWWQWTALNAAVTGCALGEFLWYRGMKRTA